MVKSGDRGLQRSAYCLQDRLGMEIDFEAGALVEAAGLGLRDRMRSIEDQGECMR
jgi:hypothetical protein